MTTEFRDGAETAATRKPLGGIRVLDFSTLLPGPLATLLLAESGADVVKVERAGTGDGMREYSPLLGASSANFALLNRGKKSVAVDLHRAEDLDAIGVLAARADVIVEQFRPGVMARFGLDYKSIVVENPGVVYCSITGYGQSGPHAHRAGHDLNYVANAGLLSLVRDGDGGPALPPALLADIAGGAYPAVVNILLGLCGRATTAKGCYLDIPMTQNLRTLGYWALAQHAGGAGWPRAGDELVTGGSARYQLYRTSDGQYLAAAPLEDRFWQRFCDAIGLPADLRAADVDQDLVITAVADRIGNKTGSEWTGTFGDEDVCCTLVATLQESIASIPLDPGHRVVGEDFDVAALTVPVADSLRARTSRAGYPALGEHNWLLEVGAGAETGWADRDDR